MDDDNTVSRGTQTDSWDTISRPRSYKRTFRRRRRSSRKRKTFYPKSYKRRKTRRRSVMGTKSLCKLKAVKKCCKKSKRRTRRRR
jgi:hypothetical protein